MSPEPREQRDVSPCRSLNPTQSQATAQGGPDLQPEVRGAAGLLRADGDAQHRDGGGRRDVRVEQGALDQRHPPGTLFSAVVRFHGIDVGLKKNTLAQFQI